MTSQNFDDFPFQLEPKEDSFFKVARRTGHFLKCFVKLCILHKRFFLDPSNKVFVLQGTMNSVLFLLSLVFTLSKTQLNRTRCVGLICTPYQLRLVILIRSLLKNLHNSHITQIMTFKFICPLKMRQLSIVNINI